MPAVAPIVTDTHEPAPDTSIGGGSALDVVPRRRLAPLVIVLLLVLAGGGVAVYLATRSHAPAPVAHDAAPDAKAIVLIPDAAPTPPDAAPIDAPVIVPVDAGHHHTPTRDAGHTRPDAVVMAAAPDVAAGTGFLRALHKGNRYLNVIVDGHAFGVTPILKAKPLPAGAHSVDLVEPTTGELVVHQQINLAPDQTLEVSEH
jgi:hypothetical protein